MIHTGDCTEVMATLDAESIDAIVTDPPYGLGFMGKAWDNGAGPADQPMRRRAEVDAVNAGMSRQGGRQWSGLDGQRRQARDARSYQAWCEAWAAASLRVAKPSAYLLAFGGTRTVHRLASAIEDAGWIIRDMLVWGYASGFPKSKASLKPAWEPIVMARKPGPLRMLAIDECRIPTDETWEGRRTDPSGALLFSEVSSSSSSSHPLGRWPANVILTAPIFDGGWDGVVGGGEAKPGGNINGASVTGYGGHWADERWFDGYTDQGTYSRFFIIPKADRSDREPVLGGQLPERDASEALGGMVALTDPRMDHPQNRRSRANVHPTVKPVDLMRHLVRLVTPSGGTVLDPFLGSGTTGVACEMEGFPWIGIEKEPEYVAIAEARMLAIPRGLGL